MPNFAFIEGIFRCPACRAVPGGSDHWQFAAFTWGFCRGQAFAGSRPYRIGDPLLWGSLPDGSTPAWTYFSDGGINLGDPTIRRLIAADRNSYKSLNGRKCGACGIEFGAVAVEVEDSRIISASIIAADSPFIVADYHVYQADGTWLPIEDLEGCQVALAKQPASIPKLPP